MISHQHKVVFVHIPKCAGTSVEHLFLNDLGLDYSTRAPLNLRLNDKVQLGPPRLAHLTASEYVDLHYLSSNLWQVYFKFALVRNPYDRLLSTYKYLGFNRWITFGFFVDNIVRKALDKQTGLFWFIRPQVDFFLSSKGEMLLDAIYRIEEDLDEILESFNIRRVGPEVFEVPRVNVGNGRSLLSKLIQDFRILKDHGREIIGGIFRRKQGDARALIKEFYKQDYDYLNYN